MNLTFNDPWWIVLIKVIAVFAVLLTWTIFNVWYERRLVGKMQHRLGPIMNGPFGLGQTLGDGLKFLLKEDFAPGMVDRVLYTLAPILAGVSAFTAWSVIPLGGQVNMFDDFDIDYNAQKYLIETRCSGALIRPYSAMVIECNEAPTMPMQ